WRGRADNLRNPMARSSRLSVCLLIDTRNSSHSPCAKSTNRQRTMPWMAGTGPASTLSAKAWRWASLRMEGLQGALVIDGPTQSRKVCNPMASSRVATAIANLPPFAK
ncbi:unnamed protein product, partial [Pararhodospirillum photometricum DSM 122]